MSTRRSKLLSVLNGVSLRELENVAIAGPSDEIAASDGQPKQLFDKLQLREWVTFAHPFGSPVRGEFIKSGGNRRLVRPAPVLLPAIRGKVYRRRRSARIWQAAL